MTTKTAKRARVTSEQVLDDALGTIKFGLDELDREIRSIAAGKAKDNGHDRGSRIAYLTQRAGSIADSVRKIEAARTAKLGKLTRAQVMEWLRAQEPPVRSSIARELAASSGTGSVLS